MSKKNKIVLKILLYAFAAVGIVFTSVFLAIKLNLTKNLGFVDNNYDYFNKSRKLANNSSYSWINTDEYSTIKIALSKEKTAMTLAEQKTGIKSRIIASILFVEQMRLYNSDTELFKKTFEPLKILGIQSQYSWGVLGLKEDTLIQIENNLKTSTSTFYLGKDYENMLDFPASTTDIGTARFNRVTEDHNQYYTYLYASLFLKQIEKQWKDFGFDISNRPEILATIYNIGFSHSKPNANPQVGGAEIDIGNNKYSFGRLAYEFYYSDELLDEFPR
jgi:hypothetical protein